MPLIQDEKARAQPLDNHESSVRDLPPAYDAISLRRPSLIHQASSPAFRQDTGGPSSSEPFDPAVYSSYATSTSPALQIDKSPPSQPKSSLETNTSFPPGEGSAVTRSPQKPVKRKNNSWLSLLPFVSSSSKRTRQSILSTVSDLVNPSSRSANAERRNAHEILASAAESCREHKFSLSSILQEPFVADHTPMYWAVVNYRQELLVALLIHARPLSVQTISEIRRACVASSNQVLFQALRVRRPPFHRTDSIRYPSLQTASDNLLLGPCPSDDIHIRQSSDGAFTAHFQISVWQKRMRAIGRVNIEFIASGRMWSVTFFSTNPPSQSSGKSKKWPGVWHVRVTLLEASPPTFFDSQLVIDVPSVPPQATLRKDNFPGPSNSNSITLRLTSGNRKLCRRVGKGDTPGATEAPTTKTDTWSDNGVNFTDAVVAPLGEGNNCQSLYENSRYLLPDGTIKGRLEVRLVKSESSKHCIIC